MLALSPLWERVGVRPKSSAMRFEEYPINIHPIPEDEGGGYLITFPDLPGCIADGETIDEAVAEARDAFAA